MEDRNENGERSGFGGRRDNFMTPKPLKVGDELEVDVEALGSHDDGIAKKDGFVIFIKGAKKGDHLKIRIAEVRPRFAIGEIIQ
ncbi:MAG: TRAM domain-containing protein [Candidatus Micrarchaeia archaeon]